MRSHPPRSVSRVRWWWRANQTGGKRASQDEGARTLKKGQIQDQMMSLCPRHSAEVQAPDLVERMEGGETRGVALAGHDQDKKGSVQTQLKDRHYRFEKIERVEMHVWPEKVACSNVECSQSDRPLRVAEVAESLPD